jgi:hypothetical protein
LLLHVVVTVTATHRWVWALHDAPPPEVSLEPPERTRRLRNEKLPTASEISETGRVRVAVAVPLSITVVGQWAASWLRNSPAVGVRRVASSDSADGAVARFRATDTVNRWPLASV